MRHEEPVESAACDSPTADERLQRAARILAQGAIRLVEKRLSEARNSVTGEPSKSRDQDSGETQEDAQPSRK